MVKRHRPRSRQPGKRQGRWAAALVPLNQTTGRSACSQAALGKNPAGSLVPIDFVMVGGEVAGVGNRSAKASAING